VGFEKFIPLDTYAVRHALCAFIGIGGIAAVWATARAIGGSRAGLLAAAALALCGIWYGAMFNHTKDIPFAAAMMGASYFLLLIGRELPRPRWQHVAMFGLLWGCALGIRVLGLFLVSYAGFVVAVHMPFGGRESWRSSLAFAVRSALALAPAFVIAYAIMLAAWPWASLAPLNPLHAMFAFDEFHYPIYTVLDGQYYEMADVPRWYEATYVGIKLTLPILVGAALALIFAVRPPSAVYETARAWRTEVSFVAFAALFPLICHAAAHGPAFSGMRHVLFTAPPIAALAGLGLNGALRWLQGINRFAAAAGAALILAGLGSNAVTLYLLHPDEYLFSIRSSAALRVLRAATTQITGLTSCRRPWEI
jgi:hypothetical protein